MSDEPVTLNQWANAKLGAGTATPEQIILFKQNFDVRRTNFPPKLSQAEWDASFEEWKNARSS